MRFFTPLLLGLLLFLAPRVRAEELVYATGRVYDADGKTPLAGALVAVYDDKNRVLDYAKTDANGDYILAFPRDALHIGRKGGGGFFYQVGSGVMQMVGGVGRVMSLPLKAGIKAAAAASTVSDPLTKTGIGAATNLATSLVDTMNPGDKKKTLLARHAPGALVMKVAMPGKNDAVGVARVFWVQQETYRIGDKEQRALTAWFDGVTLTVPGSKEPSVIQSSYLQFTSARLEPSLAQIGQTVTVTATFPTPAEPKTPVVVIAHNPRSNTTVELRPVGKDTYQGEFVVDKSFPLHDNVVCILAYAQQGDVPGRSRAVEEAIKRAGLWQPEKMFVPNPLLVASRNRGEVTLTVLDSRKRK